MTITYETEISELIKQEDVDLLFDPVIDACNDYVYKVVEELNTQLNGGLSPDTLNFEGNAPLNEKGRSIVNSISDLQSSFKFIMNKMDALANAQRKVELDELEACVEEYLNVVRNNIDIDNENIANLEQCYPVDVVEVKKFEDEIKKFEIEVDKYEKKLDDIISEKSKVDSIIESYGIDYSKIKEGTRVASAIEKYSDEIDKSIRTHISEDLFTTVQEVEYGGYKFLVTHVVCNDPSQIAYTSANGAYANGLETASSAASRTGASVVINGGHFNYSDGSQDMTNTVRIAIANGQVVSNNGSSLGFEWCIDKNGNMFSAPVGATAQDLVDMGVVSTFSCHEGNLLRNGQYNFNVENTGNFRYDKTIVGSKGACDFYVITGYVDSRAAAEYLTQMGCSNASALDMGGSTSAVVDDSPIYTPSSGSERAIGDFLAVYS